MPASNIFESAEELPHTETKDNSNLTRFKINTINLMK